MGSPSHCDEHSKGGAPPTDTRFIAATACVRSSLVALVLLVLLAVMLLRVIAARLMAARVPADFPFDQVDGRNALRVIAFAASARASRTQLWALQDGDYSMIADECDWRRLRQRRAFVTLVTNDAYVLAAAVLARSLRLVNTSLPIVALVSADLARNVAVLERLAVAGFDYAVVVATVDNPAHASPLAETRGKKADRVQDHKRDVFTKLRVFALTAYEQILFVDADCVVRRNIDHLLLERGDVAFAFAPSLQALDKCDDATYRFRDNGVEWCQSHSRELYHGTMDLRHHNSGVMLLKPSQAVFDDLLRLMQLELQQNDTCIGQPGCNDQRVINVYYHTRAHATLELTYNIFCDQLLGLGMSVDAFDPAVVHYRGKSKPWALDKFHFEPHGDAAAEPNALLRAARDERALRAVFGVEASDAEAWRAKDRCGSFSRVLESTSAGDPKATRIEK
jgi:alpha-N-acetylglucosamine transferase